MRAPFGAERNDNLPERSRSLRAPFRPESPASIQTAIRSSGKKPSGRTKWGRGTQDGEYSSESVVPLSLESHECTYYATVATFLFMGRSFWRRMPACRDRRLVSYSPSSFYGRHPGEWTPSVIDHDFVTEPGKQKIKRTNRCADDCREREFFFRCMFPFVVYACQ